jgi:hypothetical protein
LPDKRAERPAEGERSRRIVKLLTVKETAAYVPFLKRAKQALADIGVTCSINVFNTLGHRIPARDPRLALSHFDPLTDWRAQRSEFWPCPLSPAYREWLSKSYATLAEAEPYSIWVDDDLRHLPRAGLEHTCYCRLHLQRFAPDPNILALRFLQVVQTVIQSQASGRIRGSAASAPRLDPAPPGP